MYRIDLLNKISKKGLSLFTEKYEYRTDIPDPDGILVRSKEMKEMTLPSSLKAIARAGAGVNNIPIDKCSEKGIVVFNTPGANANGVKELVLLGMLLASRKVVDGIAWAKGLVGEGDKVPDLIEKGKSKFGGTEILGKKLGVVGLGAIGTMVANAAEGLGMSVWGYDPYLSIEAAWRLSRNTKKAPSLDKLLSECDFISLHVPQNKDTKGFINTDKFAIMKKGVVLLNFARGGLVDTPSLKKAVADGIVGCYERTSRMKKSSRRTRSSPFRIWEPPRRSPKKTALSWRSDRSWIFWKTGTSRTPSTSPNAPSTGRASSG